MNSRTKGSRLHCGSHGGWIKHTAKRSYSSSLLFASSLRCCSSARSYIYRSPRETRYGESETTARRANDARQHAPPRRAAVDCLLLEPILPTWRPYRCVEIRWRCRSDIVGPKDCVREMQRVRSTPWRAPKLERAAVAVPDRQGVAIRECGRGGPPIQSAYRRRIRSVCGCDLSNVTVDMLGGRICSILR